MSFCRCLDLSCPLSHPRDRRVNAVVERYLTRIPGASTAYRHDPTYHAHIHFMRTFLTVVDMAMEDEGIDGGVRLRVLRTAMYGAPDLDEPIEDAAQRQMIRQMVVSHPIDASRLLKGHP